jgi:hypothetical protein
MEVNREGDLHDSAREGGGTDPDDEQDRLAAKVPG